MRNQAILKLNHVKGPRLPYPVQEAEVRENEYKYLIVDGIAVLDGEGILYWVDTMVTTDAGGSRVYDNNAASGKTLSAAYAAKKDEGVLKSWDPPKRYFHGIYVDLANSLVEICYKPIARNLRCTLAVHYPPGTKDLVCQVTIPLTEALVNLVARVDVYYTPATSNLVSRVDVYYNLATKDLVARVDVYYTPATSNLVSRVTVTDVPGSTPLVCRVLVPGGTGTKNLVCRLYADRTP